MTVNLPPPHIFTHNETLHAIELPPLATFLNALSVPDHLHKLNDILLRYRTPQSYHRLDVREISSSELPLSSPEPEDAGAEKRGWKVEEMGDPVILEEGDTREGYKARREGEPSITTTANDDVAQNGHISPNSREDGTEASGGDTSTLKQSRPTDTRLTSTAIDQNARNAKSPTPPTTVRPTKRTSTPPPHTLPPTGPKRRIRELRLDLRSLDAAALFALETWRREFLGLDKLKMEHPDSIWYKDSTPTPTPSPSPEPEPVKRKPGRQPRKSVRKSQSKTPAVEQGDGSAPEIIEIEASPEVIRRKRGRPSRKSEQAASQSQTPAAEEDKGEEDTVAAEQDTEVDMDLAPNGGEDAGVNEDIEMADDQIIEENAGDATAGDEDIQDIDAFDILVDGPADQQTTNENETSPSDVLEHSPAEIAAPKSPTPPASPDIILMDGFNRKDDDSDFSPERSPSPVQKRGRPSKSAFKAASPPTMMSTTFRPAPPPSVMGSSGFQAAPPPVAMTFNSSPFVPTSVASAASGSRNAAIPSAPGPSACGFQDVPPPTSLGSSSRMHNDQRLNRTDLPQTISRTTHGRPLSLSPTRPSIPSIPIHPQPLQEGGTSDSPFTILDSPEKLNKNLSFVPFVREQMRIPTFTHAPVIPARGLHWHETEKARGMGKKRKEREMAESRPKARRRSSKVHFVEEEEEEEEEVRHKVRTNGKSGQMGHAGDSDDDEWADFRF